MAEIAPSLTKVKVLIPEWERALGCLSGTATFDLSVDMTGNGVIAKEFVEEHLCLEWAGIPEIPIAGETIW